jgi:MFS family permease
MNIFRALNSRNYRLFFGGQAFSNLGNMIQQVAIGWLVYRLTDSALLLGVLAFVREFSAFFCSLFAGVLADRYNKHRLLLICQSLMAVNAAILAGLTLSGQITVPLLLLLQVIFGLISGMEMPARQSFVNDLVEDKAYLTNAIALNSSLFNTARIVGPAIAGILIPLIGEGYCFLLYAASSFLVVVFFLMIRYGSYTRKTERMDFRNEFMEGARSAFRVQHIRFMLLFVAGVTFLGVSYMVILPVFAADVFQSGAEVFGFMTSAVGIGSLIGAFYIGTKQNALGLDKLIFWGTLIFGIGLAVFSVSIYLWLSLLALMVAGFGRVIIFTGTNTLLQTIAPEDVRGRVLSFYIMLFMGSLSVGSFVIGIFTDLFGGPMTLLAGSLGVIATALYYGKNLSSIRMRTYKAIRKSGAL